MTTLTAPAATAEEAARHYAARLAFETDADDVATAIRNGTQDFVLVDARSRRSYDASHLPGAISLPHGEIDADTVASLPDGLVVAYCWGPGCNAATKACAKLAAHGRQVKEMLGGFEYFVREGHPVEGDPKGNLVGLP
jgi:rhodanese-related sulfurtransferase